MMKNDVSGLVLLDKPLGLSSNAALQQVKRLFSAKKAGHTGSLDPLATGMLPLCFGEATKFSQFLLEADKCYKATGLLGIKTSTQDAYGEVIAIKKNFTVNKVHLTKALKQFEGEIKQIPSMFSALKYKGKPLYTLARRGITVPREERIIHVKKIDLLELKDCEFNIEVFCSKGTYIRNLVDDIGDYLGVHAHVIGLRRLYTAGFENEKLYSIEELSSKSSDELKKTLLPLDRIINHLPKIQVDQNSLSALQQGKTATIEPLFKPGLNRLYYDSHFKGVVDVDEEGNIKVKRLLAY